MVLLIFCRDDEGTEDDEEDNSNSEYSESGDETHNENGFNLSENFSVNSSEVSLSSIEKVSFLYIYLI